MRTLAITFAAFLVAILLGSMVPAGQCTGRVVVGTTTDIQCENPCPANCGHATAAHPDPNMAALGWTYKFCFCNGQQEEKCCHAIMAISPTGQKYPQAWGKCRPQDVTCPPGTCTLIMQIGEGGTEYVAACA